MPILVNTQSGQAENLAQDQADQALAQGTHVLPLNDPQGNPTTASLDEAPGLLKQGYSQPSADQLQDALDQTKYSTPLEEAKSVLSGAGKTLTLGLSAALENPEAHRARERINPGLTGLGEAGALLVPGLGDVGGAGLLKGAGEAAEALGGTSKIGSAIARGAAEGAVFQSGDEVSKLISQDPNTSAESAIGDVGLGALLGGAFGVPFGVAGTALDTLKANKLGQMAQDFKDRFQFRMDNPNPVEAMTNELTQRYNQMKDALVNGKSLNRQEIQKLTEGLDPAKVQDWTNQIEQSLQKASPELQNEPQFQRAVEEWRNAIRVTPEVAPIEPIQTVAPNLESIPSTVLKASRPTPARIAQMGKAGSAADLANLEAANKVGFNPYETPTPEPLPASPGQIFQATDALKRQLQEWGQYNKTFVPLSEVPFRNAAKGLGRDLRLSLEDTGTWGQAGERQAAVNSAMSDYFAPLEDFEKKFTSPVENSLFGREVDPGKIQTYWNQLGKPNAELKQSMLDDWLKASDKFQGAIEQTHANLGLESPFTPTSVNISQGSVKSLPSGAKLADIIINKGLARLGGEGIGAGVGAAAGSALGHPGIGALIGEHALGPVISSVLPALTKPLLENPTYGAGLKSALDFGLATARGETTLNRAARAVFTRAEMPSSAFSSDKDISKLKDNLDEVQQNPQTLQNVAGDVGHLLPDHSTHIGQTVAQSLNFLNGLKPNTARMGPMGQDRTPSSAEEAKYNNALKIAQSPISVLSHVQKGTLTNDHVAALQAMYPNLYAHMRQKLIEESVNHLSKDKTIPYSTRMSMAKFTGTPLDASMTPQSIQMLQASKGPATQDQAQQVQLKQKGSLKALENFSKNSATPSQAREVNRAIK